MTESQRTNSLHRIVALLEVAANLESASSGWDGWARVLGVERSDPWYPQTVAEALIRMRRELLLAQARMPTTRLKPTKVEGHFTGALNALALPRLNETWSTVRSYLNQTVVTSLGLCADALPDDENDIEEDFQQALLVELAEFEKMLLDASASELPPDIRLFFFDQIARMRRALVEYKVTGAVAIYRGAADVASELAIREGSPGLGKNSRFVSKLGGMVATAAKTASIAITGMKLLQGTDAGAGVLAATLDYYVLLLRGGLPRQLLPGPTVHDDSRSEPAADSDTAQQ